MLRPPRKKPPADGPDINAGEPWSEMDQADLEELLGSGSSIDSVASYQCREVKEVEIEAKVRALIREALCQDHNRADRSTRAGIRRPAARHGQEIFEHICKLGLEGIVSKRRNSAYVSGRAKCWRSEIQPGAEIRRRHMASTPDISERRSRRRSRGCSNGWREDRARGESGRRVAEQARAARQALRLKLPLSVQAAFRSVRAIASPDVSEILDPGTIVITRVPSNFV
jgi:hypothetical protein